MDFWNSLGDAPAQRHLLASNLSHQEHDAADRDTISTCRSDMTFGPFVSGCRGDSDFTLLFEDTILSMVPSACFIILSLLRLRTIYSKSAKGNPGGAILRFGKLVSFCLHPGDLLKANRV